MKLIDAIDLADHTADSGGHSPTIRRPLTAGRRDIRFTYPRPPPKFFGAYLVIEERAPDGGWVEFKGFTLDEVRADDWEIGSCGQPCGAVNWGPRQSPGHVCNNR
jgi:hypothetical protein